eukprot:3628455-Amphidinium_carterae.1
MPLKDMQGKLAILRDVQTQLAQLTRDAQKNAAAVESSPLCVVHKTAEVCQEEIVAGLANLSQSTSKDCLNALSQQLEMELNLLRAKLTSVEVVVAHFSKAELAEEMEQFKKYIGAQGVDQAELGQGIERLRGGPWSQEYEVLQPCCCAPLEGHDDLLARCDSIEKQMLEMTRTAAQVEQSVPAAAVEAPCDIVTYSAWSSIWVVVELSCCKRTDVTGAAAATGGATIDSCCSRGPAVCHVCRP